VTNWSAGNHAYQISLQRSTWADPLNPLPGLQSFASATYADQWVMVAGRTAERNGIQSGKWGKYHTAFFMQLADPAGRRTVSQ
jgi:hypothetical protein